MKKNLGMTDRIVRAVIAVAIGVLYFMGTITGILGIILLIVAIVLLATSVMGSCPLYQVLKLSSAKKAA